MAFELPQLPWAKDALAPVISAETIEYHYGKHHQAYVNNLNNIVPGTKYEKMSLEEIVKATNGQASEKKVFNNAAQVWNHTFFWNCMAPKAGGDADRRREDGDRQVVRQLRRLQEEVRRGRGRASSARAGPGSSRTPTAGVAIETTSNAETPFAAGKTACSRSTSGSTPTTSTTATRARSSSRSSGSSSTGTSRTRTSVSCSCR